MTLSSADQFTAWLFAINIILVLLAFIHMLYHRRPPQSMATWTLAILLLPYIGALAYFIFGLRKSLSKRYKSNLTMQPVAHERNPIATPPLAQQTDRIICANHVAGTSENNQIRIIQTGSDAFDTLMRQIQQAQHQIHLETYIYEHDAVGQQLLDALCDKARQGVEVRLLMDAIGSFKLYLNPRPLHKLKQAGGRYSFFQPIWPDIFTNQINLRNHRKIYLFDQTTLLTGGLNLSQDYLQPSADKHPQTWVDLLFEIRGPATYHYQHIFNEDWRFSAKEQLEPPRDPLSAHPHDGETVQVIPAGPDIEKEPLFETLLNSIYQAEREILIATPYFIPDNAVMHALLIALKRGVAVTLLTPKKSDHLIFDLGRSSYMRELIEAGGQVFQLETNMLHAKLIIFDQKQAWFGSANFDYRSLFLNYEIINYSYGEPTIYELHQWFQNQCQMSRHYVPNSKRSTKVFENLTRIIAPIL